MLYLNMKAEPSIDEVLSFLCNIKIICVTFNSGSLLSIDYFFLNVLQVLNKELITFAAICDGVLQVECYKLYLL